MLRGTAGLRIAVKEYTALRDEAARMERDNPTPATRLQARQAKESIERSLSFAIRALAQAEMFRHVEERYDLPCDITAFDVTLT